MPSKKMNSVADLQQSLFRGEQISVDLSLIKRQINLSSAIALCVQAAGLEDKEVYLSLGIEERARTKWLLSQLNGQVA